MPPSPAVTGILLRYAAGERSFSHLDLDSEVHDFSGQVLEGADFSGCFVVATFCRANLARARFKDANVKTCDFTSADLRNAVFDGSAIDAVIFNGADLTGASFAGASEQGHIYKAGELPFATQPNYALKRTALGKVSSAIMRCGPHGRLAWA